MADSGAEIQRASETSYARPALVTSAAAFFEWYRLLALTRHVGAFGSAHAGTEPHVCDTSIARSEPVIGWGLESGNTRTHASLVFTPARPSLQPSALPALMSSHTTPTTRSAC